MPQLVQVLLTLVLYWFAAHGTHDPDTNSYADVPLPYAHDRHVDESLHAVQPVPHVVQVLPSENSSDAHATQAPD